MIIFFNITNNLVVIINTTIPFVIIFKVIIIAVVVGIPKVYIPEKPAIDGLLKPASLGSRRPPDDYPHDGEEY